MVGSLSSLGLPRKFDSSQLLQILSILLKGVIKYSLTRKLGYMNVRKTQEGELNCVCFFKKNFKCLIRSRVLIKV